MSCNPFCFKHAVPLQVPLLFLQVDMKKTDDAKTYLTLPGSYAEVEEKERQTGKSFHHAGLIPTTKDSFQIATLTCSTKLTQNGISFSKINSNSTTVIYYIFNLNILHLHNHDICYEYEGSFMHVCDSCDIL